MTRPTEDTAQPRLHNGAGAARVWRAFVVTLAGLRSTFSTQAAFRQELALVVACLPVAFVADTSAVGRALLVASLFGVLIVELLNTALEQTLDRVSTDYHPLTKAAKDAGSAAVFLALANMAAVWTLIVILPHLGLG